MTSGLPRPVAATTGRSLVRRWLQVAVMVVGFGLCALVLAGAIGLESGLQNGLLGVILAALPLGIVVPAFMWLDRFEAEPTGVLLFAFAWGALVSSTVSLVLNTGSLILLRDVAEDPFTVGAVTVAPVVEETVKGLGVLAIALFRRREFDGIVDGVVYAGIVAAGFAFAENILYLGRAFADGGGSVAFVFFLRGILGPFAHPLFTVCTGIGLGVAVTTRFAVIRVLAPLLGLLLAMLLHGLWNLSTVTGLNGFFSVYLFLQLPIFVGIGLLAVGARAREGRLIGLYLTPYADAGWFSGHEVAMLASMAQRRSARAWARSIGGRAGLHAMEAFQDAASDLALLRMRMARGAADAHALEAERALLAVLLARRQEFVGTSAF